MWLMTGTPTPNSPMDAWALARLLRSPHTPIYMSHARDWLMRQIPRTEIWVNRPEAPERGGEDAGERGAFPPRGLLRLAADDVCDAGGRADRAAGAVAGPLRSGRASPSWRRAASWPVQNPGVVMQRMLQISGGRCVHERGSGEGHHAGPHCCAEGGGRAELAQGAGVHAVAWRVVDNRGCVREGRAGRGERLGVGLGSREIFRAFQEDDKPRVLAAVPQAMSHGLTLTAAGTIVWYSPPFSNETYEQANGRIERLGKVSGHVVHLVASDLERKVFRPPEGSAARTGQRERAGGGAFKGVSECRKSSTVRTWRSLALRG